ncbi:MAG: hypothetical protein IJ343_08635 [Clostridia bacterium]|nr:hypothetical protein [Clostridia bacterium]
MDTMAWFRDYLQAHVPGGHWSAAADNAVRVCLSLHRSAGDEASRQYVIDWADSLIGADACMPGSGKALLFALEATGEDKYREAAETVMAAIGREPLDVIDSAEALYRVLPFRMAYEMRLGGMEKVGLVAAKFREAHASLWNQETGLYGGDLRSTAYALLALVDAIDSCADQLYEHWRALVDMYREVLRGALATEAEGESAAMIVWALLAGVRMNLIDPERYLPIARRRIAALKAQGMKQAAAMLEMEGGAL